MGARRVWRIGTRRSALALAQARLVADWLARRAGAPVELVELVTTGDLLQEQNPAVTGGGRGVFVRELDAALLEGRVDLCVHSAKDVPPELPEGLTLGAFPPRADPRDALVAAAGWTVASLPPGARVGTGSPRRALQLLRARPDLSVVPLRGNVDTRLGRRAAGEFDAVVLAVAGLERLGRLGAVAERIAAEVMLPAAGQGALAVAARSADEPLLRLLRDLDHAPTAAAVWAERAVLSALGGGCSAPAGALAVVREGRLRLGAVLAGPVSRRLVRVAMEEALPNPVLADPGGLRGLAEGLGGRAAAALVADGGADLLTEDGGRAERGPGEDAV